MERKQGEQFDPAEIAIEEQQGPADPSHEASIRRMVWKHTPLTDQRVGEGNNSRHPERTLIERRQAASGIAEKLLQQVRP